MSCQNRSSSLPSRVDYQWEGLLCTGHDWVRHPSVSQFSANRIHDCFQTAVMIPLLGLHTLPPRAEQNRYCKNHLENKGTGKDRPQCFHARQVGLPLDHGSEVPSSVIKAQSQGSRGWAVILETEVTMQQPWSVPGCSHFGVHPPVPPTATQPTQ